MDVEPGRKDFGTVNPEQKQEIALGIYRNLQEQWGEVSLSGFGRGDVIYPDKSRRIRILPVDTDLDFERQLFRERGFTDEDISSGITAIIEFKFLNPHWPRAPFKQEPKLRYINFSGSGKAFEGDVDRPFQTTQLDPMHIDALKRVTYLSAIPGQIIAEFGSYDEFLKALGTRDMKGIDSADRRTESLYSGGLRAFIKGWEELGGERFKLSLD